MEVRWKKMRTHAANLRWAREWLEEEVILPVTEACRRMEEESRRKTAMDCSTDILDVVMREVKNQHNCGYSTACPGWFCMRMVKLKVPKTVPTGWKIDQKKESIHNGRKNLKRGREDEVPNGRKLFDNKSSLNVEPQSNIRFQKSPVKDLIATFELLAKNNLDENSSKNLTKHPPTDLKTVTQEEKPVIPVGRKLKPPQAKRVWTQLRSGLFGWKSVAQPTKPSKGNIPRTSGTRGNIVTILKESPANKVSKTRQNEPPKLFGGWGCRRASTHDVFNF